MVNLIQNIPTEHRQTTTYMANREREIKFLCIPEADQREGENHEQFQDHLSH